MSENPVQPAPSVLNEANPESIQMLFDKDPLLLSKQDIQRIVEKLREGRKSFAQLEQAKVLGIKKAPATKAKKSTAPLAQLSLSDLGL